MSKAYSSKDLISVEDALHTIFNSVQLMPTQLVPLLESRGRVLAGDVKSDIDIAPFANSCMDGFAVHCEDLAKANSSTPVELNIVGVLGAGSIYAGTIRSGEALRIMTGAAIPDGADAVVKIEDCEVLGESPECPEGTLVRFFTPTSVAKNIRPAGEEAKVGDIMIAAGEVISAAGIGLLATAGCTKASVYARPHVAVVSSGSELVELGEMPGPGQIRNSNTYSLAAAALDAGATVNILPKVNDTPEAFLEVFATAAKNHDMVVMSGGAAEGDFDYTTRTIRELGKVFFNKVNMKPGKAQTFGIINGVPVFGLPGNPAAAAVGFEVLVRPALRKMQGFCTLARPICQAKIAISYNKKELRREYLRARLEKNADGTLIVTPSKNQSSALLRTLYDGNCLLVLPEKEHRIAAGSEVDCLRLDIPEGVVY